MDFMILDSAGNAVESFDSEVGALRALLTMAARDARVAQELAVLAFDDNGDAVGDAITVADVRPEVATTVTMRSAGWIQRSPLTMLSEWTASTPRPGPLDLSGGGLALRRW